MVDDTDDIIDDLVAFNYARTGRISLTPCSPIEECAACGSVLESDGTCLDCEEDEA
jgi:hypothetical protein